MAKEIVSTKSETAEEKNRGLIVYLDAYRKHREQFLTEKTSTAKPSKGRNRFLTETQKYLTPIAQNTAKLALSEAAGLASGYVLASKVEDAMKVFFYTNQNVNNDFFLALMGVAAVAGAGIGVEWIRYKNPVAKD